MPAPANNPLKGFLPKVGSYDSFPYSMEWGDLPLSALMTGPTNFNWTPFENILDDIASRGHQAVFRVYLDYPRRITGIPQYLLDAGLVTSAYDDYGNAGVSLSPNYEDAGLKRALTNFIAAFGARYDGDPRIGFITVGLLGFWGEWHTYPHSNWFASVTVQNEVLAAYDAAFRKTKLLARLPFGTNPSAHNLGYHDDSFAYDTLPPTDSSFVAALQTAGETNKWRTEPIGGEVRPEIQLCMWDTGQANCVPPGQAFYNCVNLTHASWMLNQGVFADPGFTHTEQDLALAGARHMGYELYVARAILEDPRASGPLNVSVQIRNMGVAPFYYDWPVQLSALDANNQPVQTWTTTWKLSSLLPASTNQFWSQTLAQPRLAVGSYKLVMRASNPLTNGVFFRFANHAQDTDLNGWLTLGHFTVLPEPGQPVLAGARNNLDFQVQHATNSSIGSSMTVTNASSSERDFSDPYWAAAGLFHAPGKP